jgi:chemotaxis protein CheD
MKSTRVVRESGLTVITEEIPTKTVHVVKIGQMRVGSSPGVLMTAALGSALGLMIHDPVACVGGLLCAMLPTANINPEKARTNPCFFVDVGVPELFRSVCDLGGDRSRMIVKAAGCASPMGAAEAFRIGERNYEMVRRVLRAEGARIGAEDVGGTISRTLLLDLETGVTKIRSGGKEWRL